MAKLFAGTSGFSYDSWKPTFYSPETPSKKYLEAYAKRLNAVEINYTFRQLPKSTTIENWVQQTPGNFSIAIKAHQRLTHIFRLKPNEFTEVFFKAIDPLRVVKRLGPVLFQLPPNMKNDPALLESFLAVTPADVRLAFEFRNASWLNEEVYSILEKRNVSLCLAESERLVIPERITADFVYFRLRNENYSVEDRAEIRSRAESLLQSGKDVFLFFKHEDTPAGALYAEELLQACAQASPATATS